MQRLSSAIASLKQRPQRSTATYPEASGRLGCATEQRGFTLLEIMVVITLVALISTSVMLTLPDTTPDKQRFGTQKAQFAAILRTLSQRAIVEQRWYGLYFIGDTYQALRYSADQWIAASQSEPRSLPEGMPFSLMINQLSVKILPQQPRKNSPLSPQIRISPSGLFNDFELRFGDADAAELILTDPYASL
ncbi:MAG: type II secretion system GspH family protein [Pseudomonadales bacterium]|nr:type II secretion system GspH family protein [Pseudomonadales bacterium]NRA18639.1 type II secretion system protein [Oceanospirillaceae bacterium]